MTIRPLTPDLDWDSYADLSVRVGLAAGGSTDDDAALDAAFAATAYMLDGF